MTGESPNAGQVELWDGQMGQRWVADQERLDRFLAPFARAVLDLASPRPGEEVLDIGCGCGATVLEAARRMDGSGAILGVDLSRAMLARAAERADALSGPKPEIRFQAADAQTVPLGEGRFDLAQSRFGVMFFADPVTAFRNVRRALNPNGRLAFACWRGTDENPWIKLPLRIAFQHVAPPPPPGPEEPGPFSFADPDRVRRILDGAGFRSVALEKLDTPLVLGATADLDEAVDFTLEMGPLALLLADVDPDVRAHVRASLREGLAPHHGPEGVKLTGATWLVEARAA